MSPDRRRVMCQLWLVALGLSAACFEPDLPACLACDGVCPAGQRCMEGRCVAAGERCEPLEEKPAPECSAARCCIGSECFEGSDAAEFQIAAWLDWTSIRTSGSERAFDVWEDRSGKRHAARPMHDDVLPLVRLVAFRDSDHAVVERVAEEDYLVLDQQPGDVLDLLGRGDFFVVAAVALECGDRNRMSACIASKGATQQQPGFILSVDGRNRVGGTVVDCSDRSLSATCMPQLRTENEFSQCERFQLIGLRRTTDSASGSRLELRVDGQVEVSASSRLLNTASVGPTYLGGYPGCIALRGSIAALVVTEGAMTEREACELERALLRAMKAADLADSAASSCE